MAAGGDEWAATWPMLRALSSGTQSAAHSLRGPNVCAPMGVTALQTVCGRFYCTLRDKNTVTLLGSSRQKFVTVLLADSAHSLSLHTVCCGPPGRAPPRTVCSESGRPKWCPHFLRSSCGAPVELGGAGRRDRPSIERRISPAECSLADLACSWRDCDAGETVMQAVLRHDGLKFEKLSPPIVEL